MRRTAALGSSLALAVLVGSSARQAPHERDLGKHLKALAAAKDGAAREEALKFFDDLPLNRLFVVEAAAAQESAEVQEAFRRWLPHRAWNMVLPRAKIGEARRKEAELVGPEGKRRPEDFAKGVARLLEKDDAESRRLALRLFIQVRPPEPAKLVPFLQSPDDTLALSAVMALSPMGDPAVAREILKTFKSVPPAAAVRMASAVRQAANPDWVPELIELLKSDPERIPATAQVLEGVADSRAESALIGLLDRLKDNDLYGLIRALSFIGGAESVAAIRKYRDALPEGDKRRGWCLDALARLRAAGISREIVSEARAGKIDFPLYDEKLEALGDRSIVPELAAWAKDKSLKLQPRKAVIELIGVLGDGSQVEFLLECLKDERLEDSAARALGALGDPRAARPLANLLKESEFGHAVSRALLHLPAPLKDVDAPLLEILNDPEGHAFVVNDAVRIAVRSASPPLKSKLMELVTKGGERLYGREKTAWEILPLLHPEDRDALAKGRSSANRDARAAATVALASLGDAEAVKEFVKLAANQDVGDRNDFEHNVLMRFPSPPQGLLEAVEAAFRANPKWFEGAEFLAHYGRKDGLDLLKEQARGNRSWVAKRAARALLRLGERSAIPEVLRKYEAFHSDPEEETILAAALDEESAARLREIAWSHLRSNHPAGRILARRADRAMEPLFRAVVRSGWGDNEVHEQSNDGEMAVALAKLGAAGAKPVFLRWLRSGAASRRALAARCLAILGDRASIHAIAPLLDDLGAIRQTQDDEKRQVPVTRVRQVAIDAIESLAGVKFSGAPSERVAAAKEWYARERASIK